MKWALVTTILGYLVWWQFDQVRQYILPVGLILVLFFSLYIAKQKIEVLPTISEKLQVFFILLIFSAIITAVLYYLLLSELVPVYYFPPILGLIVLSRGIIRWLVNLTTKEPSSFGVMSETNRGETVRSKAEKKVADWLYANDIDYVYERKISLPDGSTILSDFYLPKSDIFVEYWGLSSADNEVGEKYRARKYEKIDQYNQYGYKLLSVYPHHLYELDDYIPQQIATLNNEKSGIWNWLKSLFTKSNTTSSKQTSSSQQPDNTANLSDQVSLFCTSCGNKVSEIGEFCVKCGTKVEQ